MYRFERMNIKDRSWWAVKGSDPSPRSFSRRTVRKSCEKCWAVQPQVYAEGWMCLDEKCSAFWKINGFEPVGELHYAQAFIEERTKWAREHNENLRPAQAPFDDEKEVGYSVSSRASKGSVCVGCGRCNIRIDWEGWKCTCGLEWSVKQSVLSPKAVSSPQPLYTIRENSGILKTQAHYTNYIVHIFTIPDCGTVIHFAANATVNERPSGPNDMFKDLQENGVGLKRFKGATQKRELFPYYNQSPVLIYCSCRRHASTVLFPQLRKDIPINLLSRVLIIVYSGDAIQIRSRNSLEELLRRPGHHHESTSSIELGRKTSG